MHSNKRNTGAPGQRRLSRRHFLGGAMAAVAFSGCATHTGQRPGILDTHTHFYDPTRPEGIPWPPQSDAFLYRPILPETFQRMVQPFGVTGTVVVEASSRIEDNQWLLDLAEKEPFIRGVVGHLKPGQPGFADHLDRFSENPLFRGIRTGLWGVSIQPEEPTFVRDLLRLGGRNLALDVLAGPDQLERVARLAAQVPVTRIVVDHCANVHVGELSDTWRDGIRAAAGQPNVHMKVSGLVEGSGRENQLAPRSMDFYRPVLDVIWEAFGENRVIFGSNWPVSARFASYETVLRIVYDFFQSKGPAVVRKFFWANATRVYGLA